MSKTYVTLSGDWITNIPDSKALSSAGIMREDFFLISQPVLSNVDPDRTYECNGRVYANEYRSMNVQYGDLSCMVFDNLSGGFGFKSMAWELSDRYSAAGHVHNYSRLSVVQTETPSLKEISDGSVSALGMFLVNTRKNPVYMRQVRMYAKPRPYIGQLKFMVLTDQLPAIPNDNQYYKSAEFSGWVYPDGRELSRIMFPDAYAFFGNSYGPAAEGKFRIPDITEFIKPYFPTSRTELLTEAVPAQNVLMPHLHRIDSIRLDGSINASLSIMNADNWQKPTGERWCMHGAGGGAEYDYKFKLAFKCNDLTCVGGNVAEASDPAETYPSHTMVPAMIYVGGV